MQGSKVVGSQAGGQACSKPDTNELGNNSQNPAYVPMDQLELPLRAPRRRPPPPGRTKNTHLGWGAGAGCSWAPWACGAPERANNCRKTTWGRRRDGAWFGAALGVFAARTGKRGAARLTWVLGGRGVGGGLCLRGLDARWAGASGVGVARRGWGTVEESGKHSTRGKSHT